LSELKQEDTNIHSDAKKSNPFLRAFGVDGIDALKVRRGGNIKYLRTRLRERYCLAGPANASRQRGCKTSKESHNFLIYPNLIPAAKKDMDHIGNRIFYDSSQKKN
jgi:hypothetical protein